MSLLFENTDGIDTACWTLLPDKFEETASNALTILFTVHSFWGVHSKHFTLLLTQRIPVLIKRTKINIL
eukprot:UN23549